MTDETAQRGQAEALDVDLLAGEIRRLAFAIKQTADSGRLRELTSRLRDAAEALRDAALRQRVVEQPPASAPPALDVAAAIKRLRWAATEPFVDASKRDVLLLLDAYEQGMERIAELEAVLREREDVVK